MGELYFHTTHASVGRNEWGRIKNGKVTIQYSKNEKKVIDIAWGDVEGFTYTNGNIKTVVKYGQYLKRFKNGKLIEEVEYRGGSNQAVVPKANQLKVKAKFGKHWGILECKKYGNSLRGEKFTYKNGTVAYSSYYGKKKGKVLRSNGKLWAEYTGKLDYGYRDSVFTPYNFHTNAQHTTEPLFVDGIITAMKTQPRWAWQSGNFFMGDDWSMVVYDTKGKIQYQGQRANRQNVGVWTDNYERFYFMKGIPCPETLYNQTPEEMDSAEIMGLKNVQLRGALCEKKGYESILKDLKGDVIDTDGDYALYSIPIPNPENDRADKVLKLLKVRCTTTGAYFTLRVPPESVKVEQAREWTFGADLQPEPTNRVFDLVQET